jgi:hypothetical protein
MPDQSSMDRADSSESGPAGGDGAREREGSGDSPRRNPAAVSLGRLGGLKGGPARARALSARRRREIARKAANARWARAPESSDEDS